MSTNQITQSALAMFENLSADILKQQSNHILTLQQWQSQLVNIYKAESEKDIRKLIDSLNNIDQSDSDTVKQLFENQQKQISDLATLANNLIKQVSDLNNNVSNLATLATALTTSYNQQTDELTSLNQQISKLATALNS